MKEGAKSVLFPLAAFIVLIALWEAAIRALKIPNYILPTPGAVLEALHRGYVGGLFWPHFLFTLQSMVAGYAAGCSMAFALGCLFAESRFVTAAFSMRIEGPDGPGAPFSACAVPPLTFRVVLAATVSTKAPVPLPSMSKFDTLTVQPRFT